MAEYCAAMSTTSAGSIRREHALAAEERIDRAEQAAVDAEWTAEIGDRLAAALGGEVELLDGRSSHDRLRAELTAPRG